jgi:hypothetical protein
MQLDGATVTLGGIAKGSGMIHPNMATMLGLLTCDAAVDATVWSDMLKRSIARSFNAVRCSCGHLPPRCLRALRRPAAPALPQRLASVETQTWQERGAQYG